MWRRRYPGPSVAGVAVVTAAMAWTSLSAHSAEPESIEELVERVGRARWTHDNRLELLAGPRRSWEIRVGMVEEARHHILISTFSWHNDEHGKAFRHILKDTVARRQVEGRDLTVRVLADASALGSFNPAFSALENQGAKVRGFNRSGYGLSAIYDGRMHDKTIIVDGRAAIVSGRNFADLYFDPSHWWLDLGVMIEGSAVEDVQMNFLKSWELTSVNRHPGSLFLPPEMLLDNLRVFWRTGRYPSGRSPLEKYMTPEFFPDRESSANGVSAAILYDNPLLRRRAASTDLVIALVEKSTTRVDLMTPFPNFTDELTQALSSAAERGVQVRLLVNDREAAIRGGLFLLAGYPTLIRLIEAGVEVWAWQANKDVLREIELSGCQSPLLPPVAIHGKMLRVDDDISVVHSSNFNIRSTYYNTEAGVVVLDHVFSRALDELVDGLIELAGFEVDCLNGVHGLTSPALMRRLDRADIPQMKKELGKKQKFLDSMGMAW